VIRRVTVADAEIEYAPSAFRRVTVADAEIEYAPSAFRRVTVAGIQLEYTTGAAAGTATGYEARTFAEGALRWVEASGTGGWTTASAAPTALVGFVLPGAAYRSARTVAAVLERDTPHHHKLLSNDPVEFQFTYRQAVTANRPDPATGSGASVPKVHFEIKTTIPEAPAFTAQYFQFEHCAKIAEGWTETEQGNVWTERWRALSMTGPTGSGYLS